jgi:dolichol-phosphate mannosyltransferase
LLRDEGIPFEILVINDGSTDGTADAVRARQPAWPELRLIENAGLHGLGRAVRCGLEYFEGAVLTVVMADRSDWPEDVVRCYRLIEQGYDCVFGSRFLPGSQTTGYPRVKYLANRVANKLIQAMFLTRHNDLTNAFKMYRRDVIDAITPLHAAHFNITIEMSLSALIRGFTIAMVPIHWSGRTWGSSHLRLREMGRRYLCTLIKIWCERILIRDDLMADLEDRLHGPDVVERSPGSKPQ